MNSAEDVAGRAGARGGAAVNNRAMITMAAIGATLLQSLDQTIANVALPYHAGQLLGKLRRDHLGPDILYHGGGDHDGAGGLAG